MENEASASIFLHGHQKDGELWVTSDTLAALFTLQYCQSPAITVVIVELTTYKQCSSFGPSEQAEITNDHSRTERQICNEHFRKEKQLYEHQTEGEQTRDRTHSKSEYPSDKYNLKDKCLFPVDPSAFSFQFSVLAESECPPVLGNCALPAAILNSEPVWCVAGLCSALRFVLHRTVDKEPEHHAGHLLGFRRSCLQACAEVSVWTKFCEVEALRALAEVAERGCIEWLRLGEKTKLELNMKREGETVGKECRKEEDGEKVDTSGKVEVEMEEKVSESGGIVYEGSSKGEETICRVEIVDQLVRYERHLERPPLLHNALKTKQQYIRDTVEDKVERDRLLQLPLSQLPDVEHKFAEGLNMTLADVLLFVSFHILITKLESFISLDAVIPLALKWHKVIYNIKYVQAALPVLSSSLAHICSEVKPDVHIEAVVPSVPDESIYKSDPERYKPRWRSFTHQNDIEAVLDIVDDKDVELGYSDHPAKTITLPWLSLPPSVNPKEGQLPLSRLERKCQQLENVVAAAEWVAQEGDTIVDFCAGGGHVGIILAYRLPQCKVVFVENKEASLLRAKTRIDTLGLKNVVFSQCNLDYFKGNFQVGVCLHACGVATDLVLLKCMEQRAAFVCSPCCYGGVQANHILSYPRSQIYCDLPIQLDQYLTLGHAADQTHDQKNPKTSQGQRCMRLVDSDRLKAAQELGYNTALILMDPPNCTPKNHLLIGTLQNVKS